MADFLTSMAEGSRSRAKESRASVAESELLNIVKDLGPTRHLQFDPRGFDIIAEVKLNSPSEGPLASIGEDRARTIRDRASAYSEGGALAISVLTEPSRFSGKLEDIGVAREGSALPVMRKDFLVDPYQILEARAHQADGVLLIIKILSDSQLAEMIHAAQSQKLFALVECFDLTDLERLAQISSLLGPRDMAGINSRDLSSLEVDPTRFEDLVEELPWGVKKVAESGVTTLAQIEGVSRAEFDVALVGSALMKSENASELLKTMLRTARSSKTS